MNIIFTLLCTILLFFAASSSADPRMLEVSVVTDWETVSYYTSIDEIESRVSSAFGHANSIFLNQLNIDIKVTHVDIPATEAEDTLEDHLHAGPLTESLIAYRNENPNHTNADVTVLLTKRNINIGRNIIGFAGRIGSVCTDLSTVIVQLTDNGLDYITVAHELAHTLGGTHDGDPPCENEPSFGYLMSSSIPNATQFFSQCSIETINSKLDTYGCLLEDNMTPEEEVPVETPDDTLGGGGGSTDVIFLLLLFIFTKTKTALQFFFRVVQF